ncbi:hypothetical protein [Megasphaera sp.]|uniref:hypothetical protein n=1 Tax=Megasphaera sp. TaxID=2023260 RepID=UPI00257A887B|nr:hypothetical protein [Megasphaera sp.]
MGNARIWEIPARPVREMPDCCNLAASKSVWLRIAAILPFPEEFGSGLLQSCRFPEEFGSGLLQSCRFPKSLAPDCCNPVVFSPELPGFREIQEKTCRKWPVL